MTQYVMSQNCAKTALLRARMGGVVDPFHPFRGDVSIDLGGAEIFMSKQLLHAPQVRARIQKMCCKRMTQLVGCHVRGQSRLIEIFLEIPLKTAGGEALSVLVDKDGRIF